MRSSAGLRPASDLMALGSRSPSLFLRIHESVRHGLGSTWETPEKVICWESGNADDLGSWASKVRGSQIRDFRYIFLRVLQRLVWISNIDCG